MVADCRSRLSVTPHAGRAVLFYSQHPNGEEDSSSLHGGCPVLQGEKWAVSFLQYRYFTIIHYEPTFNVNQYLCSFIYRLTIGYGMDLVVDLKVAQRIKNLKALKKTTIQNN